MIATLDALMNLFAEWFETTIPNSRVNDKDSEGRTWCTKAVDYKDKLTLSDLKKFTDRKDLNKDYADRYKNTDVKSRKGISALKVEISALYGFNKCFVERHKGRLHFYRDDLSQKGARNMRAVGQAMGLFAEFKKNLDQ